MSAIAGIINLDGSPVDPNTIREMNDVVSYRGPDGQGQWISGSVGLAHMHLATTPESSGEIQPVKTKSEDVVLVWDGRIDNRSELIAAIGNSQDISQKSSDSDLVMSSYLKWGAEFVTRIAGDYAFGLWDNRSRKFLCGRDPIGVRLLHYYMDESIFVFGTEIKQILAHPGVRTLLDEDTMGLFLAGHPTFGDRTFYRDIRRLPGGTTMSVSGNAKDFSTFWSPDPADAITYKTEGEYAEHFGSLLTDAVSSRLRSSTPVEILLSGGLDSGSVASIAGAESERRGPLDIRARYWKPPVGTVDEEPHVDVIASRYNLRVDKVDVSDLWAMKQSGYPERRDEPFTLPFEAMNCEGLRQVSESGVRTLLTGEGGDEAFTPGYMLYLREWLTSFRWMTLAKDISGGTKQYRRAALKTLARPLFSWRHNSKTVKNARIPDWIRGEFLAQTDLVERLDATRVHKYRDRNYVTARGGTAFTVGSDQRAAAYGVELRHPFWDSRLVD
ncbi:MAG: hypothetical protein IH960_09170, partial [Chloroflexi bacterium]|nr:hypothetical protein [Chloroflexota bacterium]